MLDVEREFKSLLKKLNRYKNKKLGFECGVTCGIITAIELINEDESDLIEVRGIAGVDSKEKVLMTIDPRWRKGRDYKYWKEYHILELFRVD